MLCSAAEPPDCIDPLLPVSDASQFKTAFESAQKANAGSSDEATPSTDGGKAEDAAFTSASEKVDEPANPEAASSEAKTDEEAAAAEKKDE